MALIQCDECGKEISDKAKACPGCGAPISVAKTSPSPMGGVIFFILFGIGIIVLFVLGAEIVMSPQEVPESYPESAFYWDERTTPHKKTIIAGVNKVANEYSSCDPQSIDPEAAYVSSNRGTPENPVFFVYCTVNGRPTNVFFNANLRIMGELADGI